MRNLMGLAALLLIGGCAGVFAPPYDSTIDSQAMTAYGDAAKITAEIQLGQFATPASYPAAADQYVGLISAIAIAKERALTLPVSSGVGQDARTRLATVLQACADRAQTLAGLHQKVGIPSGVGAESDLMTSCDQAAKAAAAMKP